MRDWLTSSQCHKRKQFVRTDVPSTFKGVPYSGHLSSLRNETIYSSGALLKESNTSPGHFASDISR